MIKQRIEWLQSAPFDDDSDFIAWAVINLKCVLAEMEK
jgi:hypothetical protein